MTEKDLQELKRALEKGDNSSLAFIFNEHADFCIENLVHKNNCTRQDAEDIFVDSVLIFRENILKGKVTYLTNVRNYVYTTCRNQHLANLQRSQSREKKLQKITPPMELHDSENPLIKAEEQSESDRMQHIANEAFELLNENCRKILHLFYVKSMSLKEIAEQTGISSAGVVKTNKYRCLGKLSKLIDELKLKRE